MPPDGPAVPHEESHIISDRLATRNSADTSATLRPRSPEDCMGAAPKRDAPQGAWWRELTRYHWFMLAVAALAWLFDTMDQQIFALARMPAVTDLLGAASQADPTVTRAVGVATMVFMLGWATGGIIFGILGDRIGRVRTMVLTILAYSAFTGLSATAHGFWDFAVYRFLTGLGVGGEFAVGVALVAEVMPERARVPALGLLQASSAVGNVTAAGVSWLMGRLKEAAAISSSWRAMFLVGLLPALLAVLVMRRLREPERWRKAANKTGPRLGSVAELFGNPRWRRNAIVGLVLASAGVIGLWGISFFVYELVRLVLGERLYAENLTKAQVDGALTKAVAMASLLFNVAGFFGVYSFSVATSRIGRKPAFAISFVLSLGATVLTFASFRRLSDVYWMMPLMGFCVFTLFGGYAIYLPELFPTRLRSTGTSFCYNVGRYVAAPGALGMGLLATEVYGAYGSVPSYRYAGVTMCAVYLLGLLALPFAPETNRLPLPE